MRVYQFLLFLEDLLDQLLVLVAELVRIVPVLLLQLLVGWNHLMELWELNDVLRLVLLLGQVVLLEFLVVVVL